MPAIDFPTLLLPLFSILVVIALGVVAHSAFKQKHWGILIFSIVCCLAILFVGFGVPFLEAHANLLCEQCGFQYHSERSDHCPICGSQESIALHECEFCDKSYPKDSFNCPYCGMSKMRIDEEVPHA